MPIELLFSAALSSLEVLLNKAILLDPISKNKLNKLVGNIYAVKCTAPDISIFITVHEEGFLLSPAITDEEHSEIIGSANALLKLLFTQDKSNIIRNNDIQLNGDASSIQDLQVILFKLDIDWEYQLSKLIGDVPTQTFSESLDFLNNFLNKSVTGLKTNIDEYIHDEKNIAPTAYEIENFYHRIDALRLRLDRSHAKLTKLEI
jgi:ubiquinone biosynthesis protein UbiJ